MTDIDKLIGELSKQGGAVKTAPHPFMLSAQWMAAAVVYLAVALSISGIRPDLASKFQDAFFFLEILALLCFFVSSSISAALLSYPDLHQKRAVAYTPAGALVLLVLVMFFAWRADVPPAPLPIHSFRCSLEITLLSLLPISWTFYVMRRYASTYHRGAGGIALLFAFSIGALWLRLAENTDSVSHLIQWHYLPLFAFGISGMWLGKKLLKW